ncbi:MAG: hypothetical protein ABFD46_08380 [Armatimonadota bacterium]
MAKDVRFIDPSFACEVVLRNQSKALYESAQPQFDRLKQLRILGITSHITDIAFHTRYHHQIGLFRLFEKLRGMTGGDGFPRDFLWSFWPRLCFGQTGHAVFSYDTEKAVLLAAQVDQEFRLVLRDFLLPVADRIVACSTCGRNCDGKDAGKTEAIDWLDTLIDRNRWRQLHRWVAALKLTQNRVLMGILTGQRAGGADPGFAEAEAFKIMICPGCEWGGMVRKLNTLDSVVRDLAFSGTVSIQLDVDGLLADVEFARDWSLVNVLNDYLIDSLYSKLETQTAVALYQRVVADLMTKRKLGLEELFGIDAGTALSEDDLFETMYRNKFGKEVFQSELRTGWSTWEVAASVDKQRTAAEIEMEFLLKKSANYLHAPFKSRVFCHKLSKANSLAVSVCHRSLVERPSSYDFAVTCDKLIENRYPAINPNHVISLVFEGIIGKPIKHGLSEYPKSLADYSQSATDLLKGAAGIVKKRGTASPDADLGVVSVSVLGYDSPLNDPMDIQLALMHAALTANEDVRKKIGISQNMAAESLWFHMLLWQPMYFGKKQTKSTKDLIDRVQQDVLAEVLNGVDADTAARLLEVYTFLEALHSPANQVVFGITLPNLKVLKDDGSVENEYDVVSFIRKKDKSVEVWIWGVTIEQDINRKRADDQQKIQKLRDHLGSRWDSDIRIVSNYVYRDNGQVCLDIDGVIQRRSIT